MFDYNSHKPNNAQVQKADAEATHRAQEFQKKLQDAAEEQMKMREEAEKRKREIQQATDNKGNTGSSQRK
jgi:hypothetical protein